MPDEKEVEQASTGEKPSGKKDATVGNVAGLGFSAVPVTPGLREKFDLAADAKGLVVTEVKSSSAAAERGLRPGDVIVEAGQEPIKTVADLNTKIDSTRKAGRKSLLLLVQSDGALRFLPLKVDDAAEKEKKK